MKRTIGLMALMLTAVAAFAQPAAARDRNDYDRKPVAVERGRIDYNRRPVVVVRRDDHRDVRVVNLRRDPYCR
jgi:hypothetical protein